MHWTTVFSSQLCFLPGCEQALCGPFGKHETKKAKRRRYCSNENNQHLMVFFSCSTHFSTAKSFFLNLTGAILTRSSGNSFSYIPRGGLSFSFFPVLFFSSFLAFLLVFWLLLAFGFSWLLASAGFWLDCFPLILP